MKNLVVALVILLLSVVSLAENEKQVRPRGFPIDGIEAVIVEIDLVNYSIYMGGLNYKVSRAVKIVTPDLGKIFLFQVKPDAGAIIKIDQQNIITEIWLLPEIYNVLEG